MAVKHSKVLTQPDDADSTIGRPSDWNASHTIENGTVEEAQLTTALQAKLHSPANDPSADEKAALAGTSGTPSLTNKYVTNADSRNTDTRDPKAHAHAPGDVT